jgi:hypothetical protein
MAAAITLFDCTQRSKLKENHVCQLCLYVCDLLLVLSVPKLLDGFYKTQISFKRLRLVGQFLFPTILSHN